VDGEELDLDGAAVAVGVPDGRDVGADDGCNAEFLAEFAGQSLFGAFAGLDLAAGELPLERHGLIGAALADEDLAIRAFAAEDERRNDAPQRPDGGCGTAAVEFAYRLLHVTSCSSVDAA
jgi:hypothetical protein